MKGSVTMIKASLLKQKLRVGERKNYSDKDGLYLQMWGGKTETSYYFSFRFKDIVTGKYKLKKLKAKTLNAARLECIDLSLKQEDENIVTVANLWDLFIENKKNSANEKTIKSYENYKNYLQHIFSENISNVTVLMIKEKVLIYAMQVETTHNKLIEVIKGMFKLASVYYPTMNIYNFEGLSTLKIKHTTKHHNSLTDGDLLDNVLYIMEIFSHEDKDLSALLEFNFYTLLRASEILNLKRSDLDFINKIIYVRKTKTIDEKSGGFKVPMTDVLEKFLKVWLKRSSGEYVFNIKPSAVNNKIISMGLRGEFTQHGIRTMGRLILQKMGVDFNVAEACLSHTIANSTIKSYLRTDFYEERVKVMNEYNKIILKTIKNRSIINSC
jgi:integrase